MIDEMTNINARKRTKEILHQNQLNFDIDSLPFIDNLSISKSIEEIGIRIIVLFAFKAATVHPEDLEDIFAWLERKGFYENLTPQEKIVVKNRKFGNNNELAQITWYQESLYALLWSVDIVPHMNFPTKECFIDKYLKYIPPESTIEDFFKELKLRKINDLLCELDLYYVLHWLSKHYQTEVNKSVVLERRKSLEWLFSIENNWNDVDLST